MGEKACFTLKRTNSTKPGGLPETDLVLNLFNWIIGYQDSRGKSKKFQIIEIKKSDNVTESVISIDPPCRRQCLIYNGILKSVVLSNKN